MQLACGVAEGLEPVMQITARQQQCGCNSIYEHADTKGEEQMLLESIAFISKIFNLSKSMNKTFFTKIIIEVLQVVYTYPTHRVKVVSTMFPVLFFSTLYFLNW